ncbi:hypothetical protein BY996DRAFT_6411176 [Phakopsora pachyrhizi]|nr:hypothetical protein BY996DRAFT_6411176 [Phakopsora pachyrhizi]
MSSEDEQLYSSEDDNRHPRKFSKTKTTHNFCHPSLLAGTSQQVWAIVINPTQNKHLADSTHTNQGFFLNPTSNISKEPLDVLGDDPFELLIQTLEAQLEIQPGQESFIRNLSQLTSSGERHAATVYLLGNISQKVERFIEANSVSHIANLDSQSNTSHLVFGANNFVWTKPPKNNIQNKPKEWKLKYLPISFCTEENEAHSICKMEIPEQQIPRLIELVKMLLEWAAPKGTSYRNKEIKEKFRDKNIQRRFALRVCAAYQHFCNHEASWSKIDDELEKLKKKTQNTEKYRYISKKMASEIDFSMVVLLTDMQVEQELIKDSDFSQNNGFTSEE